MKKLFLLLLAVTVLAACDNDKDYGTPTEGYSGTLIVTSQSDPQAVNTFEEKRFSLVGNDNGTLTLWMHETRFVPQMPTLTMEVPDIPYLREADGTLTFAAARIVPRMGGLPYEQYAITGLRGHVTEEGSQGGMDVSFTCMGFTVQYDGTKIN